MSIGMRIRVEGQDAINARLALLADRFGDLQPLMETIGMLTEVDIQENFERERSPEGVPWKPSQRALREGGKALQLIESYERLGLTKSAAVTNTAARLKVGASTLWKAAQSGQRRELTFVPGRVARTQARVAQALPRPGCCPVARPGFHSGEP